MNDFDAQQESNSDAGRVPLKAPPGGAAGNTATVTNNTNAANSSITATASSIQEKSCASPSVLQQASFNQPVLAKDPATAAASCVTVSTSNSKEPSEPPKASVQLAPGTFKANNTNSTTAKKTNKDAGLPVAAAKPKPNPQPHPFVLPNRQTMPQQQQPQQNQPHHQQPQPQQQQQHYVPMQPPLFYSNGLPYVMQPMPVHMMHPPPRPLVAGVLAPPPPPPHIVPYPLFHHPFAQQHAQHMQAYHQSLQYQANLQDKSQPTVPVKQNSIPQVQAQAPQEEKTKAPCQEEPESSSNNNVNKPAKRLKLQLVAPEEKDSMFQPLTRLQDDTYYLHDDEILVEEDPLPPPSRYAHPAFAKPTALPSAASLRIHPVPMRTVGGIQDQVHATPASCTCKHKKSSRRSKTGDACLKLYCDCFAIGSYCNQNCRCEASCYNNASEANVKPRTQAIVETLRADPQAFRKIHYTTAEQQKEHRSRLAKMMESRKSILAGSEGDLLANKPPREVLTLQLPPSYYTAPLKIHNDSTILTGLSFSLSHPRSRKRKPAGSNGGVGKKHLYHNLMLSPSKNLHKETHTTADAVGAGNAAETQRTGPTELEMFWQDQTKRLDVVFDFVRREITSPSSSKMIAAPSTSTSHALYAESKKVAETFVPQLKDDVEGLKAVAAAAKGDILARFYQESRLKGVGAGRLGVACRYGTADDETVQRLGCSEVLPSLSLCSQEPTKESNGNTSSPAQQEAILGELTIFAAQDTAILQETARIIRKTARELCERRVQRKETTISG